MSDKQAVHVIYALAGAAGLLLLAVILSSCTAMLDQGPRQATVVLPVGQSEAYRQAVQALVILGGELTIADSTQGIVSGKLHNAVTLTAKLEPVGTGTKVTVIGTLLPNKIAVGSFTEVDDYLALLR